VQKTVLRWISLDSFADVQPHALQDLLLTQDVVKLMQCCFATVCVFCSCPLCYSTVLYHAKAPRIAISLYARRDVLRLGSPLDRAISEKGVLQLLFDLRFLRNSLAGGRPAAADAAPASYARPARSGAPSTAALSQRKRAFSDVESALQVRPQTQVVP
jgi:hypothetical protein